MSDISDIPSAMSTSALESKLRELKEKSNKHSQILTAKLASSQSGQNLLHIGSSLSTLPPDLHSLLTQLHPVLTAAEATEKQYLQHLQKHVDLANRIRTEQRRISHATECADLYRDLLATELVVKRDATARRAAAGSSNTEAPLDSSVSVDSVDHLASLERCAHTVLGLVQDLQSSTDRVSVLTAAKAVAPNDTKQNLPSMRTPLEEDTERAQFLMKLAPRIRRLESDTITALTVRMEKAILKLQKLRDEDSNMEDGPSETELLLMLGHVMRGLALMGRGKEVENIFARVAIMPLVRSKVSMGRLDEGGPRGECTGLESLLEDIASSIAKSFSPLIQLADTMFDVGTNREVDLMTAGVWVPIVTALMADAGIKMAVFSPGIASILQRNYIVLHSFLASLATRILTPPEATAPTGTSLEALSFRPAISQDTIQLAQDRIYRHAKTAEFSKRWNLPIYYQLRFGDCCNRLNIAIESTREGGWIAEVFTGETKPSDVGFELPFFLELYDILVGMFRSDVILRPLANRFLRGSIQLIGRSLAFIEDGMNGKLLFGKEPVPESSENGSDTNGSNLPYPTRKPYSWGESAQDVAAVAWELAILESTMAHDYASVVAASLATEKSSPEQQAELGSTVSEVLKEASDQIAPLVNRAWNEIIVHILTEKCSGPLAAVKGVAATYRMTNRPPPTQASPFVKTILRPLSEFDNEFSSRIPDSVGDGWKVLVITTVTERYRAAVEELITTVQKTEVALQNRRATRRAASGGISDGDKVKLQLYLDFLDFSRCIEQLGVDPKVIPGIAALATLTEEGTHLQNS
eukprot:Nitzschia sp. Nitz4//scaffold3_size479765//179980//182571//NITZ4_000074-RA/size479765-processed-gene-1.441-mRNA-1//-1//CDS//3329550680//3059//frame0